MNAYELADFFENELNDVFPYCVLTISLLRQQADRIAELERELLKQLLKHQGVKNESQND